MDPDAIVCPVCTGSLAMSSAEARCTACGRVYPADASGGYDLRCEDLLGPERTRWNEAQELGSGAYLRNPESNCSRWLAEGRYARAFGEFCRLSGRVLDVGCGPYGPYRLAGSAPGTEFVGVEPLPATGAALRTYRAIAEYLPFPTASFDHVIMVSSLDHVVDPARALKEAHRVLRSEGRLHVWTHVHPPQSRRIRDLATAGFGRIVQPRRWSTILQSVVRAARILRRPAAEPDEYHIRLLRLDEARDLMRNARFRVEREMSCEGHIFFLSGAVMPTGSHGGAPE